MESEMLEKFVGTCRPFASVDVAAVVAWIAAIPFADWPQQDPLNGEPRPAMVTDLAWHGFDKTTEAVVNRIVAAFPGCEATRRMLSAIMPGHWIDPHTDARHAETIARIHVPLTTNRQAVFITGGQPHRLEVGKAYLVNTEAEHSIRNDGDTPRIHFMFDVRRV